MTTCTTLFPWPCNYPPAFLSTGMFLTEWFSLGPRYSPHARWQVYPCVLLMNACTPGSIFPSSLLCSWSFNGNPAFRKFLSFELSVKEEQTGNSLTWEQTWTPSHTQHCVCCSLNAQLLFTGPIGDKQCSVLASVRPSASQLTNQDTWTGHEHRIIDEFTWTANCLFSSCYWWCTVHVFLQPVRYWGLFSHWHEQCLCFQHEIPLEGKRIATWCKSTANCYCDHAPLWMSLPLDKS